MAAGRTLHNAYLLAPGLLHRVRQRRALHHAEAHLQHFLLQMIASQHARGLWYVAAHGFVAADESFLRQPRSCLDQLSRLYGPPGGLLFSSPKSLHRFRACSHVPTSSSTRPPTLSEDDGMYYVYVYVYIYIYTHIKI